MITFATLSDFEAYSGVKTHPENIQFLLNRANELVFFRISQNFVVGKERHVQAAKNAVCAQVMFWISANASPVDVGVNQNFSLGDLSMSGGKEEGVSPIKLCPLSLAYLRSEGLTYKGLFNECEEQKI